MYNYTLKTGIVVQDGESILTFLQGDSCFETKLGVGTNILISAIIVLR